MRNPIKKALILAIVVVSCISCSISINTSGKSIHPDAKTVSVQYFNNLAPLGPSNLSQTITLALREKFADRTNLIAVNNDGDLSFEGEIRDYNSALQTITGNEAAGYNRLTITVFVRFNNKKDPKLNFEKSFSEYKDYNASEDLASVQTALIKDIQERLIDAIFKEAVVNW